MQAPVGKRSDEARPTAPSAGAVPLANVNLRARVGAVTLVAAVLGFVTIVAFSLNVAGTVYAWQVNMISDLGDSECRMRGGRWICSPAFALFNAGLVLVGALCAVAGCCLMRLWGRLLAGTLVVMGVGLVVAGVFPAGDDGRLHMVGVVLALVVPALGLLLSAMRPQTAWLDASRAPRAVLAIVALVFCAESRLPDNPVPRGAGELVIIGCLLLALLMESIRIARVRSSGAAEEVSTSSTSCG